MKDDLGFEITQDMQDARVRLVDRVTDAAVRLHGHNAMRAAGYMIGKALGFCADVFGGILELDDAVEALERRVDDIEAPKPDPRADQIVRLQAALDSQATRIARVEANASGSASHLRHRLADAARSAAEQAARITRLEIRLDAAVVELLGALSHHRARLAALEAK